MSDETKIDEWQKDDSGPAFPGEQGHTNGTWNQTWNSGMSLRDYAVIQFASAMASSPCGWPNSADWKEIILRANEGADAMIAARKATTKTAVGE